MDVSGDTQILSSQLQSILDTANKTLSVDQVQLLAQEIQETTDDAPEVDPSHRRKRKANHCDGTNCGPTSSPMKRRMQAPNIDLPSESQAGRFRCACSEWVSLRDENGFTLASNAPGATSQADEPDFNEGSTLADPPATLTSGGQPVLGPENDQPSSILAVARADSSSLETTQASLSQVKQVPNPGSAPSPNIERASVSDESPSKDELHATESGSGIANFPVGNHVKELSSQAVRWDAPPKQRRPNRTEAERIQEFHADPHVAEVEPYRVRCALCNKWIKLRNNSRYCSIPWKCHRDGCTRMHGIPNNEPNRSLAVPARSSQDIHVHSGTATDVISTSTSCQPSTLDSSPAGSPAATNTRLPKVDPSVPPASVHPSLQLHTTNHLVTPTQSISLTLSSGSSGSGTSNAASGGPRRARLRDAELRRATLEADPHTEIVEPDRILCSICKKWVKLRPNSTYCSAPWYSHTQRCISRKKRIEYVVAIFEILCLISCDVLSLSLPHCTTVIEPQMNQPLETTGLFPTLGIAP
ncbi:hypothetical protein JB92DRAFT_614830 [Gautieria morchelliformis]|nr:hypothetical protein JB92DRAFT_614830 [Gautieria morchelliformis]